MKKTTRGIDLEWSRSWRTPKNCQKLSKTRKKKKPDLNKKPKIGQNWVPKVQNWLRLLGFIEQDTGNRSRMVPEPQEAKK